MRHCLPELKERKMQAAFVSAARRVKRVTNTYCPDRGRQKQQFLLYLHHGEYGNDGGISWSGKLQSETRKSLIMKP